MTTGSGYLPVELYDDLNQEWFPYDINDADRLDDPQTLIAEKHLRDDFRITVGLSDEPCTLVSACGSRRVALGIDNGGKRTIKWRLRTGVNAKRLENKSAYLTKAPSHVEPYSKDEEGAQKGSMTH